MKKKLLIVSHALELGGAERSLIGLLNAFDFEKYDVDLFLLRHEGELMREIPSAVNLLPEIRAYTVLARPIKRTLKEGHFILSMARLAGKMAAAKYNRIHKYTDSDVALEYSHKYTCPFMPKIQSNEVYDLAISFLTPHYFVDRKVHAKRKIAWIHTDYSRIQVNIASETAMWKNYDYIASISDAVTENFLSVFPMFKEKIILIENILPEEFVKKQEESEAKKLYRGYDAGSGTAASESTKKRQEVKPQKRKKSSMPFLLYLFIVLAGGFALYKCGFPEMLIDSIHKSSSVSDSKKNTSSKGGKDKKDVDKKTTDNTTSDKAGEKKEAEHMLEDTENSHMSVENCLSTDAYNTVISEDGSFSFGYPKYLFNHSEMNALGNSYSLTYKEGSEEKKAELAVYTEENEGNALENAKQLYDRFSSQVNKIYFKMQPTRTDSEGMARTLIGASVDSSETTGVYIIAANDGEKNYILKFTYPDPDMKDDYNAIDYVVDCVYRYCSFSGGTYRPRTYQQFLKDDMGKKK